MVGVIRGGRSFLLYLSLYPYSGNLCSMGIEKEVEISRAVVAELLGRCDRSGRGEGSRTVSLRLIDVTGVEH